LSTPHLFDLLRRLHSLAIWASDPPGVVCARELLLITPLLSERSQEDLPDRLVPFFEMIAGGKYDEFGNTKDLWDDLRGRARAAVNVSSLASNLYKTLPKRTRGAQEEELAETSVPSQEILAEINEPSTALQQWVSNLSETAPEEERARRARLASELEGLVSRRKKRLISEVDVHATALFSENPLRLKLPPDQVATIAKFLLDSNISKLPDQSSWPQIRTFATHALKPGVTWTHADSSAMGMRLCGYSLQGSFRRAETSPDRDVEVISESDGSAVHLSLESNFSIVRATVYTRAGIIRGIAIPRRLSVTQAELKNDLQKAVGRITSTVVPAEL